MKRIVILLLFVLINISSYSQDTRPVVSKNQMAKVLSPKNGFHVSKFPGYNIKIKPGTFRLRTYSNDCIQLTFIVGNQYQLRFYVYYDVFDNKITNAISFRYFIKYKRKRDC